MLRGKRIKIEKPVEQKEKGKNHFNTFEQKKKSDLEFRVKIENYYEINEVIKGKLKTYESYYQI